MILADDPRMILDRLIRDQRTDYRRVSLLIGRNPAYIQQFIKRGSPKRLSEEDRSRLAAFFGVSEEILGSRHGRIAVKGLGPKSTDIFFVPRLSIGASAGAGIDVDDDTSSGSFAFDGRWLRSLGVERSFLSMIRVEGDSMAPTLNDKDDILVDGSDTLSRLRDGIYVLRMGGLLMVKRVSLVPGQGRISVMSDNSHYPSYADIGVDSLHIVGRVVWFGRRIG